MKRFSMYLLLALPVLFSFKQQKKQVRYLPLGDSYTICTGTDDEKDSWPYLMGQHLSNKGMSCTLTGNPARNGFSTQDLIDRELPLLKTLKPDFVTILIGVNDWVRQVPQATFEKNLDYILNTVQAALPNKQHVLLVTIPDFGVTPQGAMYSQGRNISKGIAAFNAVIAQQGKARGLQVADVFELSKAMGSDATLVAADGLHPSAKEYALWEKVILDKAVEVLK